MKHLLHFLKPFTLFIIVILGFTILQTYADLELPTLMSKIVDTGIQYQGVESTAMEVMTTSTYDELSLFSDDSELLSDNYTLIKKGDDQYLESYKAIENQDLYILNDVDSETKDAIASNLVRPIIYVTYLASDQMLENLNMTSDQVSMAIQSEEFRNEITNKIDQIISISSESDLQSMAKVLVNQELVAAGVDTDARQLSYTIRIGLVMLGFTLIAAIASILRSFLSALTATRIARNLRKQVFEKIESFSQYEFTKFSTASLITRTTNDIQQIQNVANMAFRMMLLAPVMGIMAFLKVIQYKSMLWIIGLILLIILVIIIVVMIVAMPKFQMIQKLVDRLNLIIRERLENNLVVRAFNSQIYEENKFEEANKTTTKVNIFVNRIQATLMPIMIFIMNFATILVIYVGAQQVDLGNLQIGQMMAFIQYVMQVLMSFMMLTVVFIMIPRAFISAKRINEILDTDLSIIDTNNPIKLENKPNEIVFENVGFKYPNAQENVLCGLNFKAKSRETIAIVGSTGSGKSTLINLIPRFFDATEGSILINGVNIKDLSLKDLRSNLGYIPQKASLFSGTIESNLKYANENISQTEIDNILEIAQASEFIKETENGLLEEVSQGGTNFSGGQKQRLSIARALAKNAKVYLFDDSLSALDFKTASNLNKALNKLKNETDAIIFIVAQRISSIVNSDQIIVLDNGKIVGIGKHQDLMKTCSVYQEIAASQLSKGELE